MKTKEELELEKQRAAFVASSWVKEGMRVGLGSGTTMAYAIRRLGERVRNEGLKFVGVATSSASERLAMDVGIRLITLERGLRLDLTIDGADEIGPKLSLIKGGGGALFREKLIASASRKLVIIGDSTKPVSFLGKYPLPIEVIPFAAALVMDRITDLGGDPVLRRDKDRPAELARTDQGNWLLDCRFTEIPNPAGLAALLAQIPGILEHGLFVGMASAAIVADGETVSIMRPDLPTEKVLVHSLDPTPNPGITPMPTTRVRLGTFNCENLFDRPKIFTAANASALLGKLSDLRTELAKTTFDVPRIKTLLNDLKGFVTLNEVRRRFTDPGAGRDTWLGWPEFVESRLDDKAIHNTARVVNDCNCDILCTPEVEDRLTLKEFYSGVVAKDFPAFAKYREVLLVDGNDPRGIDVGLASRFPVLWLKTHISEESDYFGKTVPLFSRDCIEAAFQIRQGVELIVLGNHLKSRIPPSTGELPAGQSDPESRQRRKQQAARVAEIAQSYNLQTQYVAVMGDLNDDPGSESLSPLMHVPDLHNLNSALGTHRDEPKPIDYILVSTALKNKLVPGSLKIERRGIFVAGQPAASRYDTVTSEATSASDHAALFVDFELT